MSRRSGIIAIVIAALAALAAGAWFGRQYFAVDDKAARANSALIYGLALPDLNGKEQSLGQWRGKLLVVNFWATWCVPCREEMPEFVRAQEAYGAKGLQFVGIAADEQDKVARFAKEIALNYPALIGGFGAMELSKTFGNRVMALPFTIVLGRDGTVLLTQLGPVKPEQLKQIIAKTL